MRLGRRRRQLLAKVGSAEKGPIYVPVRAGIYGAKFVVSLREILTSDRSSDRAGYERIFKEGGCAIAATLDLRFTKLESDGEFGMYQHINPIYDTSRYGVPEPLWFRNQDMKLVDGSNEAARIETPGLP